MESWRIDYMEHVIKYDIPALSSPVAIAIKKTINDKLSRAPLTFSKPLQHSLKGHRRLRVGDYRVVFVLDPGKMLVRITAIAHRKHIYP